MTPRTKKRLVVLAALALLMLGALAAYGARSIIRQRSLARDLEIGMAAYACTDYPVAMQHLSRYVGRIPTNPQATLALADCRRRIPEENGKHLVTALAYARAAAKAAPHDPKPLEMMLEICEQLGFSTEALEGAKELLKLNTTNLDALRARTDALAAMGKIDGPGGALESAKDMAAKHPEFVGAHDAVVQLMQRQRLEIKAIRAYVDKVIAEHSEGGPSMDFALFDCKVAIDTQDPSSKEDLQRIDAAIRRAASVPVRSREELSALIRYLDLLQLQVEGAIPPRFLSEDVLARTATDPKLANDVALLKAERAWKSGHPELVSGELTGAARGLADLSDREIGLREILRGSAKAGNSADSEASRSELKRRGTTEAGYWGRVLAGLDALGANDLQQSVIELSEAVKQDRLQDPTLGFAQYFLGEALSRTGDWQAAAEQFAEAARRDPVWRMARMGSVTLLADNGRFEEARQQADSGLSLQKQLSDAILYAEVSVRMLEARRGSSAAAAEINRKLDAFHRAKPGVPILDALRARALLASGQTDEARTAAQELLSLPDPAPQESLVRLAVGLRPLDPALADRLDALAAKDSGAGTNSVALRATMLAAAGQLDQAKALLQQAIARSEGADKQRLTVLLGSVLDSARDPAAKEEAKRLLVGVADAEPKDASVQLAVLRSSFAWSDESIVKTALARIATILGQESTAWRLFEARRLLTFEPLAKNAARIISSDPEGLNLAQIVRNDAGNIDAALLLAEAYLLSKDKDGLGDSDNAIRTLARAVDADPSNPAAYPRLIELLQKTGRPADATQRLTAFLAIQELPVSIQRQRASLLRNQGMLPQYTSELKALAARGLAEDRVAYARDRAAVGDGAEAGAVFDALLADETPSAEAVVAAAQFITARDGLDAGLRTLSRLPAVTNDSDRKRLEAMLNIQSRRYDEAERLLKECTADNSAQAWADLADFYLQQKRRDDAERSVRQGLAAAPEDTRLLWLSGTIRMSSGKEEGAAFSDLTKAAGAKNVGPDTRDIVEAYRNFGQGADESKLVVALEGVTRKYPTSFQAWQLLVGIHRQANRSDQAVKAALVATQLLPADARAARLATETLAQAGRFSEADAMANRWRELAPADALAVDLAQARIKCLNRQAPEALKLLDPRRAQIEAAAEERPEDIEVYAATLAANGRVDDARQTLGARVQTVPAWGVRYLRVADVLLSRPEDARNWLQGLKVGQDAPAELVSAVAQAWFTLGRATMVPAAAKTADLGEAIKYARRLAAMPGQEGIGNRLLGTIYMIQGDHDAAIAAYRLSIAKLPDDAELLNNLAYLLELRPDGSSEAAVLATRALDLAATQRLPDSTRSHFLETLGVAQLRLGNYKEAEAAYRAGLAIDPNALDLNIGLAEALLGLQQFPEAQQLTDRIAELIQKATRVSPELSARFTAVRERLAAQR